MLTGKQRTVDMMRGPLRTRQAPSQRDMVRQLLIQHGYNEQAVRNGYAQAEREGLVERRRNESGLTEEGYARAVWRDGHKTSNPWIPEFCRSHGIRMDA